MSAATDLIVRYYEAIEQRDLEAVLATTHAQVRFEDFLDGGEVDGLAAARDFYRRMFEFAPDLDLITVETLPDGRVRTEFQSSIHSPSGHLWSDTRQAAIYTLADGLIQGVELLGPTS
ncbi:nuclear transport factor 2 family protein [Caulobacter sp. CCG-8]|uniref:nuclear transport factor 2 family protein n=1 Tax=Caulobacter sp. CCG-8 TaxID=3127958 RepID=UPI00307E41D2